MLYSSCAAGRLTMAYMSLFSMIKYVIRASLRHMMYADVQFWFLEYNENPLRPVLYRKLAALKKTINYKLRFFQTKEY